MANLHLINPNSFIPNEPDDRRRQRLHHQMVHLSRSTTRPEVPSQMTESTGRDYQHHQDSKARSDIRSVDILQVLVAPLNPKYRPKIQAFRHPIRGRVSRMSLFSMKPLPSPGPKPAATAEPSKPAATPTSSSGKKTSPKRGRARGRGQGRGRGCIRGRGRRGRGRGRGRGRSQSSIRSSYSDEEEEERSKKRKGQIRSDLSEEQIDAMLQKAGTDKAEQQLLEIKKARASKHIGLSDDEVGALLERIQEIRTGKKASPQSKGKGRAVRGRSRSNQSDADDEEDEEEKEETEKRKKKKGGCRIRSDLSNEQIDSMIRKAGIGKTKQQLLEIKKASAAGKIDLSNKNVDALLERIQQIRSGKAQQNGQKEEKPKGSRKGKDKAKDQDGEDEDANNEDDEGPSRKGKKKGGGGRGVRSDLSEEQIDAMVRKAGVDKTEEQLLILKRTGAASQIGLSDADVDALLDRIQQIRVKGGGGGKGPNKGPGPGGKKR